MYVKVGSIKSCISSLKNQKAFDLVSQRGKKLSCKYCVVVVARDFSKIISSSEKALFLGMKVGRRLDKRAVVRNKIKRRIRHLIRLLYCDPQCALGGFGLVIIPKRGFDKASFSSVFSALQAMLIAHIKHDIS